MPDYQLADISELVGQTLREIKSSDRQILFVVDDTLKYDMYHEQDCCENVYIEDVVGDWADLIGTPILSAEESTNAPIDTSISSGESQGETAEQWTYYRISTIKGTVSLRWYGCSNGYYAVDVSIYRVTFPGPVEL